MRTHNLILNSPKIKYKKTTTVTAWIISIQSVSSFTLFEAEANITKKTPSREAAPLAYKILHKLIRALKKMMKFIFSFDAFS